MDVGQRSVIFHDRLKAEGRKRIHTKLCATYGRNVFTEDSVEYWVCEHDGGRRAPTDLSNNGRPLSDIGE
jgi:hypothetical protein